MWWFFRRVYTEVYYKSVMETHSEVKHPSIVAIVLCQDCRNLAKYFAKNCIGDPAHDVELRDIIKYK